HNYSYQPDNFDLENYSRSGQIQWHQLGDVSFTPALVLPRLAKAGQDTHEEGAAVVRAAYWPMGQYTVDFTVLKTEQIRVPAGTFSCIRVRMNLDLNVGH